MVIMSHPEQKAFLSIVASNARDAIQNGSVLEIGSYDVNGEMRELFKDNCREYIGVDLLAGPSVDVVGFGHELTYDDEKFALTFSAECFEHDMHWKLTFLNMVRMTKMGGIVAFTCGGPGRPEHGTIRTNPSVSPGTQSIGIDYYRNLSEADFCDNFKLEDYFSSFRFYSQHKTFDLYFVGVKKNSSNVNFDFPTQDQMKSINKMTTLGYQLTRLPLRIFSHFLPEERYQDLAVKYLRIVDRF
jgi:hypothetical protein